MKIIYERPPVYDDIIKAGLKPGPDTVFAYGNAIYNPNNVPITPDLEVHEGVHIKQQSNYPEGWWWRKYLDDAKFRLEQEIEAYQAQYIFICKVVKDRNRQHQILSKIAGFLASPMYGNLITHSEAIEIIKQNRPKVLHGSTTKN